jgi:hypothetical protein
MDTSEKNFEAAIESWLISENGGYRQGKSDDNDVALCLLPLTVIDFGSLEISGVTP